MLTTAAKYLIKALPDPAALAIIRALAGRTQRAPVLPLQQAAMARARKLGYGENGDNVAWAWGDGPAVIFVHGWGGRAAQMAPLAWQVAQLGFRSIAIDVTGHGDSPQRHTRWEYFLRDIAALSRSLGEEIHAYVGHSAGGLAAMAARAVHGIRARRYVCISAPSHPYPPIIAIQKRVSPRNSVLERYREYLAGQFQSSWALLQAGSAYADAGPEMLLFYDETDRYIAHSEGDRIRSLCPGARLIKTSAYGHQKILAARELAQAVGEFLQEGRA